MKTENISSKIETTWQNTEWTTNVSLQCNCDAMPLVRLTPRPATTPAYLRRLRAAEMAAWESSGGDYLRSSPTYSDFVECHNRG